MTTGSIMTTLAGLTYYAGQTYTVEERYQLHEEDFEDFTKFPCILVVDGNEEGAPYAIRTMRISYHPTLHFITENMSVANLKLWRDNIRNAVMGSAALWAGDNVVNVDGIIVYESGTRKLQHIAFNLTIEYDNHYTIA